MVKSLILSLCQLLNASSFRNALTCFNGVCMAAAAPINYECTCHHMNSERRSQLHNILCKISHKCHPLGYVWASSHLSSIVHKSCISPIVQFITISVRISIYNHNTPIAIDIEWNSRCQTKPCLGKCL